MKNGMLWLMVIIMVFVLSWYVGGKLRNQNDETFQVMTTMSCQPDSAPQCKASFADASLEIVLTPPVVVMSPIPVKMTTPVDITEAYLHFGMKNMDMGMQRYRLTRAGKGVWQSEVILPVCSLGRSDWTATLEVRYQDQWWRGEFDFEAASQ